jgi:putative tryptophan/tyrosine transport system substrate-binding protein
MQRREFIAACAAAAWTVNARAQQSDRLRRIGVLMAYPENDREGQAFVTTFREGLQKLGWAEGRNIQIDIRWDALDQAKARPRAREVVALKPELILTQNTPATEAMLQQTSTIPIIFALVSDPVGSGFVESLAHPGGNVTGFTTIEASIGGKWLELLKEIAPSIERINVLFNPITAPFVTGFYLPSLKAAAAKFSVEPLTTVVHDSVELESAISEAAREPGGGLIVMPDDFLNAHRAEIILLTARYRLPAVYPWRFLAELGGLLSYGSPRNQFRLAATYVDRILRGEKPADLAVQAPTKYELVINLKTAKAIGLDVPPTLLSRADEVIE